jgi:Zn-dependent protease
MERNGTELETPNREEERMFTVRWRLFRVFGMPIRIDASWLIILGLVTWMLATYFFARVPGLGTAAAWAISLGTALAYFVCIVLHELGHALTAKARGMSIRGITLFLLGGVAELGDEPPRAADEFWMAIAGPIVSAVLAGIFWGLTFLAAASDWPALAYLFLVIMALINAAVLIFNMIPAFPLDGGRVFRSILWALRGDLRWATYYAATLGMAFGYILLAAAAYFFIFPSRYFAWDSAIWAGLIGWFVIGAARASYQHVIVREMLHGQPVATLMHQAPLPVTSTTDLRSWVKDYVRRFRRKTFPVTLPDGRLAGIITTRALAGLPRQQWSTRTVADVMRKNLRGLTITPATDAMTALMRMQRHGLRRLFVAQDGHLLGAVSVKDLLVFVENQTAAEARHQHA